MMNENELRKLKRVDLLELLISQSRENEELRHKLEEAERKLADREIQIAEAGSIAEAALRLSGVFEAAQEAADRYLENIRRQSESAGGAEAEDCNEDEDNEIKIETEIGKPETDDEIIEEKSQENAKRKSETGRSRWMKIKGKSSR